MVGTVPKVFVIGVGMTKFEKPGRREDFDYPQMAAEAVTKALKDARLQHADIESACVGYVYGSKKLPNGTSIFHLDELWHGVNAVRVKAD